MIRKVLTALRRMLRSRTPKPRATDEMIRRETSRATSDLSSLQGKF